MKYPCFTQQQYNFIPRYEFKCDCSIFSSNSKQASKALPIELRRKGHSELSQVRTWQLQACSRNETPTNSFACRCSWCAEKEGRGRPQFWWGWLTAGGLTLMCCASLCLPPIHFLHVHSMQKVDDSESLKQCVFFEWAALSAKIHIGEELVSALHD